MAACPQHPPDRRRPRRCSHADSRAADDLQFGLLIALLNVGLRHVDAGLALTAQRQVQRVDVV